MSLTWPVDVPEDLARTRRARETLVTNGLLAPGDAASPVRPVIERSWRRCIGEAVSTRCGDVPYLDPADLQPRLREAAAPVLSRLVEDLGQVKVGMFLSDRTGRIIARRTSEDALVEHVDGAGGPSRSAYCVRLLGPVACNEGTGATRGTARPAPSAPPLHPLPDVDTQLDEAVRFGECLIVDGPPGSGKRHVATAALVRRTGTTPSTVDCAEDAPPNLSGAADHDRGLLLRHLQDLSPREVNRVKAAVERAGGPVAITVDLDAADEPVRALVAALGAPVRLPALREMPDQVPHLVAAVLAALPGDAGCVQFSSDALQQLMRWSWPGNVAELRRTVEHLARRLPGGTVGVLDLPTRMRDARPRGQTMMESAERDAIVTALRRAGGNRSRAAAALGIGRTTLYRKLQAHRIDG